MMWFAAAGMVARADQMHISGFVYDSLTGAPLPNYPVNVVVDSCSTGFTYNHTTYTGANGFYVDTIVFSTPNAPTGIMHVWVFDCQQIMRGEYFSFGPGNLNFNHNFYICSGTPPPSCHADFYTTPIQPPLTMQFTNTSTGSNGPWFWSFGDGTSATTFDPHHTYGAPGYYSVTLHMGDSLSGCNDWKTLQIHVGDTTGGCHANFSATPIAPPLTMQFNNLSTGSNGPWFWYFGDGNSATTFDPHHTYAAPGLYQVSLSIGDSNAGCWDYESKMIQVGDTLPPPCHVAFTWYQDSTQQNFTVHFNNYSTPENSSWSWNFGDSTNISNEKNPTHTFPGNGVYNVCLTIMNQATQCYATLCHEVHVGPPPPPPCENWITHMNNWLDVSFEGHLVGNPPATYTWGFGDGTGGTGKNITHHYAAPGLYPVTLTTVIQDSNQCTWTRTQDIFVGDSNNIHQVYGQVFEGNFPLHFGMAMIFSNDTVPGGMPFFASSPLDSMGVYTFPYVPSGSYVIWAMPFDSAGQYLPTFFGNVIYWEQATTITLGQPANPYNINLVHATNMPTGNGGINGHVNTVGLKSVTVNQIAMILTNEQGEALGYRKVNAAGTFDFTGMAFGTYFLKPELPNVNSQLVKVVLSAANPTATVNMTYNGTNILGISDEAIVSGFTVYPNPVQDVLNLDISLLSASTVTAEVYNFTGQVVARETSSLNKGGNKLQINLGALNAGIYTLRMTSPEGISIVKKIVVR